MSTKRRYCFEAEERFVRLIADWISRDTVTELGETDLLLGIVTKADYTQRTLQFDRGDSLIDSWSPPTSRGRDRIELDVPYVPCDGHG